jgi:predicted AlkP superfamily phosphohydrolase/phosphomutase
MVDLKRMWKMPAIRLEISRRILVPAVLMMCGVLVLLSGCGDNTAEKNKLVIIGIDSADWALLDPMLEEGRLPRLQQLLERSTRGRMLTFRPLEKSPLLWASICTGLRPEVHGVGGFVKGSDQKPVNSADWLSPAIWDIAGAAGKTSAVIGMWTTYPARPINGVMVSDYLPYGRKNNRTMAGLASPDSLNDIMAGYAVDPESLGEAELGHLLPGVDIDECAEKFGTMFDHLREIHAADLGYLNVARHLAADDAFDMFFFYLRGPDMISHKFWPYHDPSMSPTKLDPEAVEMFGQVVTNYYEWVDEVLAEVLAWFPDDRQVVTVSDHGFFGPRQSRQGIQLGTQEHSPFGIFTVRSPRFEAGSTFDRLELLDVGPTMMALMGLPPSAEMLGHVLGDNLTSSGQSWHEMLETERVESYQMLAPTAVDAEDMPEVDEAIRKQLRSLGYIN